MDDGLFFRYGDRSDERQGALFEDEVTLDAAFYDALRQHPVPLLESAVRLLKEKSLALDLYVWLAYRLHSLKQLTTVSWASLFAQFGGGASSSSGSSSLTSSRHYPRPWPPTRTRG